MWPQKKKAGGVLFQELGDGGAAGMLSGADAVESGAVGRAVADQHERVEGGEGLEAAGEFRFGVFARGVEGRDIGVAQPGDPPAAELPGLFVEVPKPVGGAELGDLGGGLVVAGQDPNLVAVPLEDAAAFGESARPVGEVAGGDVEIGGGGGQRFQGGEVLVDVGKQEQSHAATARRRPK